jgi:excisionase family DNA binding protein
VLSPNEIDLLANAIVDRLAERGAGAGDDLMDIHGAAKVLRCSVPTVERLVAAGRVTSIKVGRLRRFRRGDLLAIKEKGGPDE